MNYYDFFPLALILMIFAFIALIVGITLACIPSHSKAGLRVTLISIVVLIIGGSYCSGALHF